MKRALMMVAALAVAASACSGGSEAPSTMTPTPTGPAIETTATGGELGAPVLDGGDRGHYLPLKSANSFDVLKDPSSPTNQTGVLLSVKGDVGGPFLLAMEGDAAAYLRVNRGWQVTEVARDPSWRPASAATVPHLAVGGSWVVSFRTTATGEDDREDASANVVLEGYDLATKTYHTTTAVHAEHSVFTNTLQAVDDHSFSFLFADGPIDDARIPYVVRRTVDLTTFRFIDEAIDIGNTNRLVNATAHDDGYVVDLQRPTSQRSGIFVRMHRGASDPLLQLTMKEAPAPNTIDGYRVDGAAKSLALVGSSGSKTMLPTDFASAAVAGAVDDVVYLRYVGAQAKAISSDGVALVDMKTGAIATAFDLSGSNRDATGPSADGRWATGSSRALLVGSPTTH
jgi:hypothetical protein